MFRALPDLNSKPLLKTVEQFCHDNPIVTQSAMRNLIHKSATRYTSKGEIKGNGLIEAGAIKRIGRKVLIDEVAFYRWVDLQQMEVI